MWICWKTSCNYNYFIKWGIVPPVMYKLITIALICGLQSTWAASTNLANIFPKVENVKYVNLADTVSVGKLLFTKCLVNDPSKIFFRNVECAAIDVPEDYDKPEGKKISIFIIRLKAIGKSVTDDPLVLIQGGPGAAASETFIIPGMGFDKVLQQRDIFLIDQRGTGKSNKLQCDSLEDPSQSLTDDLTEIRKLTQACFDDLAKDNDLTLYTTSVAIKDYEQVRTALGYQHWNVYGVSYGTRVALHYLRQYPNSIRTLMLDGVVYPELNLGPDIAHQSQRALDQLIQRCLQAPDCDKAFPNFDEGVESLLNRLEQTPLVFEMENFTSGSKETIEFSKSYLVILIRLALYNDASTAILPLLLYEAYANNNFSPLARNASEIMQSVGGALSIGMHNSVVCTEDIPFIDGDYLEKDKEKLEKTYMGTAVIDLLKLTCEIWPSGKIDSNFKEPLKSGKPVLLMSGSADPITPPEYAQHVETSLTNSTHLVVSGHGHGVARVGCMSTLIAQFIDTQAPAELDPSCLNKQLPDPFFIDFNGPAP